MTPDPIAIALAEDLGSGDLTSQYFVTEGRQGLARIVAKEEALVAGAETAREVFLRVDPALQVTILKPSGSRVARAESVLEVRGEVRSILTAERVALNFIQRLSAVATLTRRFVDAVAGTGAIILDTRKTTPGLRALEKAAVLAGGGENHRFGLFDRVLVKDNHLAAEPGRSTQKIEAMRARAAIFREAHPKILVEVEADTLEQVRGFLEIPAIDIILLDNMSCAQMREAVALRAVRPVKLEASGGVTLDSVRAIAEIRGGFHFRGRADPLSRLHRFLAGPRILMQPHSDAALLRRLRQSAGYVSASELGDPAQVAERVRVLRGAGYCIEEHPCFGCRLLSSPDRLVADDILSRLPAARRWLREIVVFERTGSTNDLLGKLGRQGVPEGIAAFAEEQTAGRGRLGRVWQSEPGAGLWFSLLLRPAWPPALWTRLTLWAACAVARGVESATGAEVMLKWPNDLYAGGRKLAGILVESSPAQGNAYAVAGIGLNANHASFPESLAATATSLRLETGAAVDRNGLAAAVLQALDCSYPDLPGSFPGILQWARERDFLREKWVTVSSGTVDESGLAIGLDDDGALLLRRADGSLRKVTSGEVTRVTPDSA